MSFHSLEDARESFEAELNVVTHGKTETPPYDAYTVLKDGGGYKVIKYWEGLGCRWNVDVKLSEGSEAEAFEIVFDELAAKAMSVVAGDDVEFEDDSKISSNGEGTLKGVDEK